MSGANHISISLATVLERSLDATANNIANMSTTGFKASRPLLETLALDVDAVEGHKVNFVQDHGHYLSLEQGALIKTQNSLDIALAGPDWFGYETEAGVQAFGRDGRLVLSASGELSTTTGAAVLDAAGSRISLPADIGMNFTIARDGTVTDSSGSVLAKIGTFSVSEAQALNPIGGGLYVLMEGAGSEVSEKSSIVQGFLEQSNVNGTLEVTRMMEIQRAYERAIKVIDQTDQLTRTAIQRISRSV